MSWAVAALYRFTALDDLAALRAEARRACAAADACGTLLIAPEGVNGTLAAPAGRLPALVEALDRLFGIRRGTLHFSGAGAKPFARLKVRLRREIITLGAPEADPVARAGTYVEPQDWNALIADPDVLLLDTRNRYETMVGTFAGAVDPGIGCFTEFKEVVAGLGGQTHRKVAMFCTGGIRCEKASAYMRAHGFADVFHLKGGILAYLAEVPAAESRWIGDCYVFDGRVAVGHGLAETGWSSCFGCGAPLQAADRRDARYEAGVSCRHCLDALTPEQAARLRMRHRQITGSADRRGNADAAV